MREALAAADHDYILAEPVSRPKRARGKTSAVKRRGSRRGKVQTRRYIGVIASALCVAAVAGIAINALSLQKRRHPAPLFARAAPTPPLKEPAVAESLPAPIPVPAPRPQTAAASQPNERPLEKPQTASSPGEKAAPAHAASGALGADPVEARPQDPISQLLQANAREPQSAPSPGPSKTVLAAQRALVKLGYVLKADGVAGATTRQAIERYERDHKRPVDGKLTPALLRQLSAEAGVPVN